MTVATPISVVIPTFQRRAATQRALQALARQTLPAADYEVIVSIDGSEDGTREMVAGFPAPGLYQSERHLDDRRSGRRVIPGLRLLPSQFISSASRESAGLVARWSRPGVCGNP